MSKNNKIEVWLRVNKNNNVPKDMYDERIRLIKPDGKAEWANGFGCPLSVWKGGSPCWYEKGMTKKQSITAMKEYDKSIGYKTVKIGEL